MPRQATSIGRFGGGGAFEERNQEHEATIIPERLTRLSRPRQVAMARGAGLQHANLLLQARSSQYAFHLTIKELLAEEGLRFDAYEGLLSHRPAQQAHTAQQGKAGCTRYWRSAAQRRSPARGSRYSASFPFCHEEPAQWRGPPLRLIRRLLLPLSLSNVSSADREYLRKKMPSNKWILKLREGHGSSLPCSPLLEQPPSSRTSDCLSLPQTQQKQESSVS